MWTELALAALLPAALLSILQMPAEPGLVILNEQSYPSVGDYWVVDFRVSGTSDLSIEPGSGTVLGKDLEFVGIMCGPDTVHAGYDREAGRVESRGFSCGTQASAKFRVLTAGKHRLILAFAGRQHTADNQAYATLHINTGTNTTPDNKAWFQAGNGQWPPDDPDPPGDVGYQEYHDYGYSAYDNIDMDDANSNAWLQIGKGFFLWYNFTVNVSKSSIVMLNFTWIGYDSPDMTDPGDVYWWNHSSSSWILWAELNRSKSNFTYTRPMNESVIDHYIDDSGLLHLGVYGGYEVMKCPLVFSLTPEGRHFEFLFFGVYEDPGNYWSRPVDARLGSQSDGYMVMDIEKETNRFELVEMPYELFYADFFQLRVTDRLREYFMPLSILGLPDTMVYNLSLANASSGYETLREEDGRYFQMRSRDRLEIGFEALPDKSPLYEREIELVTKGWTETFSNSKLSYEDPWDQPKFLNWMGWAVDNYGRELGEIFNSKPRPEKAYPYEEDYEGPTHGTMREYYVALDIKYESNSEPDQPSPGLVSAGGTNRTDEGLNCSARLSDPDGNGMNVTVVWYMNHTLNTTIYYNNSYPNGTLFFANLGSSNTSKSQNWSCRLKLYDGTVYSGWGNSTDLVIMNSPPDDPSPGLVSADGTNSSTADLNCSARLSDPDDDAMDVEVKWYNNGTVNTTLYYNYSYANGTLFFSSLGSGNLSLGETWKCGIRLNDTSARSGLINSSELSILDATAPSITDEAKVPSTSHNDDDVFLNATVTDASLESVWIRGNWTGSWANYTVKNSDGDVYYLKVASGNFSNQEGVGWRYYANDSEGNTQGGTTQVFKVANRVPQNASLLEPSNGTATGDNTTYFNWTDITDDDGDSFTYTLQVDNDTGFTSIDFQKSSLEDSEYTLAEDEALAKDVWYWRVLSDDGYSTNASSVWVLTVNSSLAISSSLSTELDAGINWSITSLPVAGQAALGNNGGGATEYDIEISATGTTVDLYMKADGDLTTDGGSTIGLANETFSYNKTDSSVPSDQNFTLTDTYTDNQIGDGLGDGDRVYLKFFLSIPGGQSPGTYNNTVSFKTVPHGAEP